MLLKLFRVCLTPIFWRSKHPRVNDLLWAFKASYLRGVLEAILRRSNNARYVCLGGGG